MIKVIKFVSCVMLATAATPLVAAQQDYKCFINSSKKGDQVVFYRWSSKNLPLKIASLTGKKMTDSHGQKYFIKSVEECVLLSKDFSSEKAKALDKSTLR